MWWIVAASTFPGYGRWGVRGQCHDPGRVRGPGRTSGGAPALAILGTVLKIVFALATDTVQSTARDLQVVLLLCGSVPAVLRQSPFITPPS